MKTHRLFTYGTLQSSRTMSRFCEREMTGTLARLADYERRLIPGMGFPFVVRMPGMLVEGVLYEGLTDQDIFALDRYESEGRLYDRLLENVLVVKTGERKLCYVYVPHGAMHDQVLKTGGPGRSVLVGRHARARSFLGRPRNDPDWRRLAQPRRHRPARTQLDRQHGRHARAARAGRRLLPTPGAGRPAHDPQAVGAGRGCAGKYSLACASQH
jgi:gamma-glutamylcyclotransferase (GGCT)/AIG2-like uncharacterized protein YtfP